MAPTAAGYLPLEWERGREVSSNTASDDLLRCLARMRTPMLKAHDDWLGECVTDVEACALRLEEFQGELLEVIRDLADDAGYNLAEPPAHWCVRDDGKDCLTCGVHGRIAALGLEWK